MPVKDQEVVIRDCSICHLDLAEPEDPHQLCRRCSETKLSNDMAYSGCGYYSPTTEPQLTSSALVLSACGILLFIAGCALVGALYLASQLLDWIKTL